MLKVALPKRKSINGRPWGQIVLHLIFILLCLCYVLPLMLVFSVALSDGLTLSNSGFTIFPVNPTLDTYRAIFRKPDQILNAYGVTIVFTVLTTIGALLFQATCAYSLSRREFKLRMPITFILFFTTLFSGGMVPNYILICSYLHLNNTIWVYIIPSLVSVWNIIVLRTNFQTIPDSLVEAAIVDGAGEWRICFTIVIPLCTPALAAIGFLTFIGKWNDWMTTDIYVRDMSLYSLQYLLQKLLDEVEYAQQLANEGMVGMDTLNIPSESFRFAMATVAMGPMIFAFPFFQKYFAKGLTLGAVKG